MMVTFEVNDRLRERIRTDHGRGPWVRNARELKRAENPNRDHMNPQASRPQEIFRREMSRLVSSDVLQGVTIHERH